MPEREVDRALETTLRDLSTMTRKIAARPGYRYLSPYEFYFKEGGRFSSDPYTPEEQRILLEAFGVGRKWQIQQCFYNAQTLVTMEIDGLDYAEGYTIRLDSPFPIHHAWAVIGQKPVDVTMRDLGDPDTCDPELLLERASKNLAENAYWGVIIPVGEVLKTWGAYEDGDTAGRRSGRSKEDHEERKTEGMEGAGDVRSRLRWRLPSRNEVLRSGSV